MSAWPELTQTRTYFNILDVQWQWRRKIKPQDQDQNYTLSEKKTPTQSLCVNFGNYELILIIFSVLQSVKFWFAPVCLELWSLAFKSWLLLNL